MILIIGGAFQGKKGFAKQLLLSERKPGKGEEPKEIPWCDGETASWEEFSKASWCFHVAAMVRRQMDESAVGKALLGAKVGKTVQVETPAGIAKYKIVTISR